mmetsp:Transcript_4205/g.6696  ORF Transcript_4205/g.6696 Transcript_4205/m.6696 type:complete len:90 (-) Transcript_4205:745-1014(-)
MDKSDRSCGDSGAHQNPPQQIAIQMLGQTAQESMMHYENLDECDVTAIGYNPIHPSDDEYLGCALVACMFSWIPLHIDIKNCETLALIG